MTQSVCISNNVHMRFVQACQDRQANSDQAHCTTGGQIWCGSLLSRVWGTAYILVAFTHNHTQYTRITLPRTKDEALDAYGHLLPRPGTKIGHIKCFRSCRRGESTRTEFDTFLKGQGMERRLTAHDMPRHNGATESQWDRPTAVSLSVSPPSSTTTAFPNTPGRGHPLCLVGLWPKNWSSTRIPGDSAPYQRLHREKPNLAGLSESGQHL